MYWEGGCWSRQSVSNHPNTRFKKAFTWPVPPIRLPGLLSASYALGVYSYIKIIVEPFRTQCIQISYKIWSGTALPAVIRNKGSGDFERRHVDLSFSCIFWQFGGVEEMVEIMMDILRAASDVFLQ
jgi:hypothetical protein